MRKEQSTNMTSEQWDFKYREITAEINELIFISQLGDRELQQQRCEELASKYKTKAVHFEQCAVSRKQTDIDELANTITSYLCGRRPK